MRTRRRTVMVAAGATTALLVASCTVQTDEEDPAELDQVETFPGEQDGEADDAEGRVVPDEDDEGFDEDPEGVDPGETDDTGEREDAAEDVDAPEDADLATRTTDVGTYLVDGEGWPVYANVEDETAPVACVDACLDDWPIVSTASEPLLEEGLDPELVTTLERPDGTLQLVFDGYPLHRYAHDTDPDALDGHGSADVWSVISPDGELLLEDDGAG